MDTRLKIFQETFLVECTFVEDSEVADVRFQFYLASREIPFAGHPTLVGVASLSHRGLVNGTRLTVETQAGIIPIEIGENGQIIMTQIEPVFGPVIKSPLVADAFCLSADDIIHPPQVVSTGLPFTVAILRDHDALSYAVLQPAALLQLQAQIDMPNTDCYGAVLGDLEWGNRS